MVQTIDEARRRRSDRVRVPPHNLEVEESLLGAMLLSRDAITAAAEHRLDAGDFYKPSHGHVFDAIMALYGQGEPADPVTVAEELRRADLLESVGERQGLVALQADTPASANAGRYAQVVSELALLRRLIVVAGEIAEMGYEAPSDVVDTLDRAEQLVFDVAERRVSESMVDLHQSLQGTLDHLEYLYGRDGEVTGVATGFDDLDGVLLGLQPSSLVIVAARPGQGKSAFALGAAKHVATTARRPVLFFSMEMGHLELTKRLLASEARVESKKLATGNIPEGDWSRLSHAVGRLAEAPLFIDDNPHCTVMEMRAKARRIRARYGDLGLVVVDYIQLMSSARAAENRQLEVSEISRGLKILARELQTPVVALSQLNRQLEYRQDKRPVLADLRESGCLTADTRITRADTGAVVTMGELLETGARDVPVWSLDHRLRLVPARMTHVFPSGVKRVHELRLASGRRLRGSGNHPFLTFDGWARLDQLEAGDRIAVARRAPLPGHDDVDPRAALVPMLELAEARRSGAALECRFDSLAEAEAFVLLAHRAFGRIARVRSEEGGYCVGVPFLSGDELDVWLRQVSHVFGYRWADDDVPRGVRSYVRQKLAAYGPDVPADLRELGFGRGPIARARVQAVAARSDDATLSDLAHSDVRWDEVVSIEELGDEPTFDATVEGTHNFLANGVIAHNSLEQDADVVCFIYRDEVYNPESDDRGIAEIIVGKHRSGPTDSSIRLAFRPQFTQFANMAKG